MRKSYALVLAASLFITVAVTSACNKTTECLVRDTRIGKVLTDPDDVRAWLTKKAAFIRELADRRALQITDADIVELKDTADIIDRVIVCVQ